MKRFLSPSTHLELLRFMNWEGLLAEVAEGADDGVTGATLVRTANRPDLKFDIMAGQPAPLPRHTNEGAGKVGTAQRLELRHVSTEHPGRFPPAPNTAYPHSDAKYPHSDAN